MIPPMRYAIMIAIVCAITAGSVFAVERRLDRAAACDNGLVVPDPDANPGLVADCEALMTSHDALRGEGSLDWSLRIRPLNWSYDYSIMLWEGVLLEGEPSRVVGLRLAARRLNGIVPPELAGIERLRYLNLRSNLLTGPIPPELGQLSELESLQLQWNQLRDSIPLTLGRLEHLRVLNLRSNLLRGPVPRALGDLGELRELRLDQNQLAGHIPRTLGALPALELVRLAENGFAGCVPSNLLAVADNDFDLLGLPACPPP